MERILVADDGSDSALRAVNVAAELAGKTGAELFRRIQGNDRVSPADMAVIRFLTDGLDPELREAQEVIRYWPSVAQNFARLRIVGFNYLSVHENLIYNILSVLSRYDAALNKFSEDLRR